MFHPTFVGAHHTLHFVAERVARSDLKMFLLGGHLLLVISAPSKTNETTGAGD